MSNFKNIIEESFKNYAAEVIQQRALISAEDGLKPSARMCFYAQKVAKIDAKHTIQPSPNSVGEAIKRFYTHGDASCYSLLMRYAKNFAVRYPLIEVDGSIGSLESSRNEPAARYTKMRLNKLGTLLFEGIKEKAVDVWYDNYSETEQYPSVLPSLGYYNIVNGTTGIGIALASSIPQFNLVEVNNALIKLLWNEDLSFEEIYCPPDFATGGVLINEQEVKESLRVGRGKSCRIRSVLDYNEKERCLVVSQIPYGTYTSTICGELSNYIEENANSGIERFLDLTGKEACIKIYLKKNVNIQKVIKQLYKNTSLESHFGINITMLEGGIKPRVFGWKDALLNHLKHEEKTLTNIYNYRLNKIEKRIDVINGILIAIANIEEVIEIIKKSATKDAARISLAKRFGFNETQTEAILKITLSRLANLEIVSFKNEREELLLKQAEITKILNNKDLLKKEIEKHLVSVRNQFGDERRTICMNLDFNGGDEDAEPIEKKELIIYYTNKQNIYTEETSTLVTGRRNSRGKKIKLGKQETIVETLSNNNFSNILAFTNKGRMFSIDINEFPIGQKVNINTFVELDSNEIITKITVCEKGNIPKYFVFITKNGLIKKTQSSEYFTRKKVTKAINLKENDSVVNVLFMNNENIGILTKNGYFVNIETSTISPIGRVSMGRKAVNLSNNDYVIDTKVIPKATNFVVAATNNGLIKKTDFSEYQTNTLGTKGNKIQKINKDDFVVSFQPIVNQKDIIVISSSAALTFSLNEVPMTNKAALGVKAINLKDTDKIIKILV